MLVLELDPGVRDQVHHGLVVHDDLAVAGAAEGHRPVVHDLGGQVVRPALGAEQVAALQPWEIYFLNPKATQEVSIPVIICLGSCKQQISHSNSELLELGLDVLLEPAEDVDAADKVLKGDIT